MLKTSSKFAFRFGSCVALTVATVVYMVSTASTAVRFPSGADRFEAERIFEIAAPFINDRLANGDSDKLWFSVSRHGDGWVVAAHDEQFGYIPGGVTHFFLNNEGDLLHVGGGI